jgi:hypothetical protein
MPGFTCTVDVITWLDATLVPVGIKPTALSNLELLLLLLLLIMVILMGADMLVGAMDNKA